MRIHAVKGGHGGFLEKLLLNTEFTKSCWLWKGKLDKRGYGGLESNKARLLVAAYTIMRGLELDHLRRINNRINPNHLEPVTHKVNVMRGLSFAVSNSAKTHCDHGHDFTEGNTIISTKGSRGKCDKRGMAEFLAKRNFAKLG